MNGSDGVLQMQGDIIIFQTLNDITGQSPGTGKDLVDTFHLQAFQGQAPGHYHPDIAAAQYHCPASRQQSLDIYQALGGAGGIDPGRTAAGDHDLGAGAFPAAHG